jgi:hypothetical protein
MSKPSRLRGLNSSIVKQIRPDKFEKFESAFNRAVAIHDSDAKATLWVLLHAQNNPGLMIGGEERKAKNQPEHPSGVDNPQDVFHGRPDFNAMSADERLAWVEAHPAYAQALLRGRKKND